MLPTDLRISLIVEHETQPTWGPGRVLAIRGSKVDVYFRDKPRRTTGEATTTLGPEGIARLRPAANQDDAWLAALPFRKGQLVFSRAPLTRDEAVAKFLRHFPEGFEDARFLPHERTTKFNAHRRFSEFLSKAGEEHFLEEGRIDEITAAVNDVFRPPFNLLHPTFELPRLREALEDTKAAATFYKGLFRYLEHDTIDARSFDEYSAAVEALPATKARPIAKWPVSTVLPFIAKPDQHILLRAGMTEEAAQWLGFDLGYTSQLEFETYNRLLQLSSLIRSDLESRGVDALKPRDQIDIQSFMWVVVGYP